MAKIVVIEDTPQNARLVNKLLVAAGHQVKVCETGEDGLTTVFESAPELVLIDLGLPDIDGQTVIALMRQQPSLTHTKLIAFTAFPESTAQSMAKAYGCDGVIVKPIDTRQFAAQIAAFLTPIAVVEVAPLPESVPVAEPIPVIASAPAMTSEATNPSDAPTLLKSGQSASVVPYLVTQLVEMSPTASPIEAKPIETKPMDPVIAAASAPTETPTHDISVEITVSNPLDATVSDVPASTPPSATTQPVLLNNLSESGAESISNESPTHTQ